MDREQFDHLCRQIGLGITRRNAVGRTVVLGLLAGLPLAASEQARAGGRRQRQAHKHRQQGKQQERRADRQDRRKDRRDRPPQGRPPGYDCSKPDSQGKPCLLDALGGVVTRCCNGVCPDPANATCIGRRGWTGVQCDNSVGTPCRDADRLCCSGSAWCDEEEGECACWYNDPGESCFIDDDCNELTPACVCGYCR